MSGTRKTFSAGPRPDPPQRESAPSGGEAAVPPAPPLRCPGQGQDRSPVRPTSRSDDRGTGRTRPDVAATESSTHQSPGAAGDRQVGSQVRGMAAFLRRLQAMDVANRGMLFAAVLLLCVVPFVIVLQSLAGRSAVTKMTERFGLTEDAAKAVGQVLTSPSNTSSTVTGLSWVFFILGGIAAAAVIQELYERAFGAEGRGITDKPRQILWLGAAVAAAVLSGWAQPWLRDVGGPALVGVASLVGSTAFWWFSMWLLLAGRLTWRQLFPSALATGICWLGMEIVFLLIMSNMITSNYLKYGPIGLVFALMAFLIAIGVVIILGAIVGVAWRERHSPTAQ
jgi:membrane protein